MVKDDIPLIPDVPEALREAAQLRKLIPFVGAGASLLAGCPSWAGLADGAFQCLIDQGKFSHSQLDQIRRLPPRVKLAVGGEPHHVRRLVLRTGLQLLGAGIGVGLAVSVATNRLLVSQLWNVSPHDPITLIAAVVVILIIGAVACSVPARRAMRVEPIVALRHE